MNKAKVLISGRLTNDVVIEDVGENKVVNINIAVNRKEEVTYYVAEAWNKYAELLSSNLKKGTKVLVIGDLYSKPYLKKDGSASVELRIKNCEFDWFNLESKAEGDNQ